MRVRSAFKATYRLSLNRSDEIDAPKDSIFAMERKISEYHVRRQALKFTMAIHAVFVKANDSSIETNPAVVLNTQPFQVYAVTDIPACLVSVYEQLISGIELFQRNGFGWVLAHVNQLDLTLWELDAFRGSPYHELPMWSKVKRVIVNVKNIGQDCFKWAFLAGMHPISNNRNNTYFYTAYEEHYDFSSLPYPVPLKDIAPFANRNNVSINVYGCTNYKDRSNEDIEPTNSRNSIHPLKVCSKVIEGRHVNQIWQKKMDNNITRTSKISVGCYVHKYRSINTGVTSQVHKYRSINTGVLLHKYRSINTGVTSQVSQHQHRCYFTSIAASTQVLLHKYRSINTGVTSQVSQHQHRCYFTSIAASTQVLLHKYRSINTGVTSKVSQHQHRCYFTSIAASTQVLLHKYRSINTGVTSQVSQHQHRCYFTSIAASTQVLLHKYRSINIGVTSQVSQHQHRCYFTSIAASTQVLLHKYRSINTGVTSQVS